MERILPVYKPVGMTSYDVIRALKRAVHPQYKVGHGGTLDPFADGVLLLLLGKATKRMNELSSLPKTYRATARLGARSDTLDNTGKIVASEIRPVTKEQIEAAARKYVGVYEQTVPEYSAAKVKGQPRYKLARKGQAVDAKTKPVRIEAIEIEKIELPEVTFTATVGSGTYVRQLSYDIFHTLGIESYLEKLTRTEVGEFKLQDCTKIENFGTLALDE